jgi:uncharacterized protein GlcG (DUF336 family)
MRIVAAALICLALQGVSHTAAAQEYLLPDGAGKREITGACESCHGVMAVVLHKRSPRQWATVLQQMRALGASLTDSQTQTVLAYLNSHFGQPTDFVPQPMPLRGHGPGVALALEAAQTAQAACLARGQHVSTLVVDSGGTIVTLLTGDGVPPIMNAIAATKTATVLKFKVSSGEVMKRLETDASLAAQIKNDPEIGEVRQGGLPIVAGSELVGAIAVAGAFGPADTDEKCARAGLDRIASRLAKNPS